MRLTFVLLTALSIAGVAHSQQFKAIPVKSYVLTDADGTPRYLVQYSQESTSRTMYRVRATKPVDSTRPERSKNGRRPAPKKRVYWPTEVM
jgi:hypothetical protein